MMILIAAAALMQAERVDAECRSAPAEALVGETYRRGVPTRAKRLSGAGAVRVIWPGEVTTMEFRPDRLTLRVDHRRRITAVRCG
jgi:hypothetical protein